MRVVHDLAPPENAGCWCWTTFLEHGLHEFHYAIVAWIESLEREHPVGHHLLKEILNSREYSMPFVMPYSPWDKCVDGWALPLAR